jgi:hypothetical protein
MQPRQREIVGNVSLAAGLVICYFKGYSLKIVALCGACFADHFQCMLEVQQPPKGRVKSEHGPKNRTIENFTNFGGVNGIS